VVSTDADRSPKPAAGIPILAAVEWVLLPVGLALLRFALPHDLVGDDFSRFQMLGSLFGPTFKGTMYSLVGPILAAPLWLAGRAFGDPAAGVLWYDWLLFCGALVGFWFIFRRTLSPAALRRFLLLLVAGSMIPRHLLHFGAEPFTNFNIGLGLALVGLGVAGGWAAVILGSVNTPATLPALGLSALRWTFEQRRARYLAIPAIAFLLIVLDNWIRLGSPSFTGGYNDAINHGVRTMMPYSGRPGFSFPFFFGLLSLTLSFGKGLVFFASGLLLLPTWRLLPEAVRPVLRLWLAFVLGLVLLYAKYWGWYGGFSAGPRYMLFASFPATLLLAQALSVPARRWYGTLAVLLVLAMSCWTSVATTVFEKGGEQICTANNYILEHLCWYTPEFSVLWNPFVGPLRALTSGEWAMLAYGGLVCVWLALPLLARLLTQSRDEIRDLALARGWRW
jgi:hypothetical protein